MQGLKANFANYFCRSALCIVPLLAILTATISVAHNSDTIKGEHGMAFALSSKSFSDGGDIGKKFTCDGTDVSPELQWTGAPAGTKAFALIADDPDAPAGTWTHWLLYDLPPDATSLAEGTSKQPELANGARQGRNDFGKIGYNGPCPPPGKPHRYFFKLYALDGKLNLKPGASKQEVERAIASHTLAKAEWIGRYKR